MSGGVTTGSILNARVFKKGSGPNKGQGVKPGTLAQTKVSLANRNRISGGGSYASLSRSINGRAVIVNTNAGCCHGASNSMSTMEKIAMWNAIAQSTLQLTASIGSMVTAAKANRTSNTGNTGAPKNTTANGNANANGGGTTGDVKKSNASLSDAANALASTVTAGGTSGADCKLSMQNATTSAQLQEAITNSENYLTGTLKPKIDAARKGYEDQKAQLKTMIDNDDVGKQSKVVDQKKADVKTADDRVKHFDVSVQKHERNCEEANKVLDNASATYKSAREATQKLNGQLTELESDLGTARQKLATMEKTLPDGSPNPAYATAEKAVNDLNEKVEAKRGDIKKAEDAEAKALNDVDTSKKGVTEAKQKLTKAKGDVKTAKKNLSEANKALDNAKAEFKAEQEKLDGLKQKQADLDSAVKAFEDMEKEEKSLSAEITSQKGNLTKLQQKESKKMDKLDGKIAKQEAKSDAAEVKGNTAKMQKAENNEIALRAQRDAIEAGHYETPTPTPVVANNNASAATQPTQPAQPAVGGATQKSGFNMADLGTKMNAAYAEASKQLDQFAMTSLLDNNQTLDLYGSKIKSLGGGMFSINGGAPVNKDQALIALSTAGAFNQ